MKEYPITTINSRKFDNSINRSWSCRILEESEKLLIFEGIFESEITHSELGTIRPGTISYEYYWKEKWFNVFRFHEPEGDFKFFYCNINLPPIFHNRILDYIDLDIDVLVSKDFSVRILDEEEFKTNSIKFQYPNELIHKTYRSLNELLSLISQRAFPFDKDTCKLLMN